MERSFRRLETLKQLNISFVRGKIYNTLISLLTENKVQALDEQLDLGLFFENYHSY